MNDKITSLAGLRKALDEGLLRKPQINVFEVISLINEFEAGLKERIENITHHLKVKDYPQEKVSVVIDEAILEELLKELKWWLGGAAAGGRG